MPWLPVGTLRVPITFWTRSQGYGGFVVNRFGVALTCGAPAAARGVPAFALGSPAAPAFWLAVLYRG